MSREIFFKIELVLLFNIRICLCCLPAVLQNHTDSFVTHKMKNVNYDYKPIRSFFNSVQNISMIL